MPYEIFASGPVETNSILFYTESSPQALLFDLPLGCVELWETRLKKLGKTLAVILLTHSHWDHLADAADAKRAWKVPIGVHKDDKGNLEKPGSDGIPLWVSLEGVAPDFFFVDGEEKRFGDVLVRVFHTPGHSPGCVCFYLPEHHLLISGDTLFKGTIGNMSLPTARPKAMKDSLKKILALPKETIVIPGHGGITTIGKEQGIIKHFYGDNYG